MTSRRRSELGMCRTLLNSALTHPNRDMDTLVPILDDDSGSINVVRGDDQISRKLLSTDGLDQKYRTTHLNK